MMKYLLLLITASLATSCMKKPDTTPDYGPEVQFEDIQKAANFDMPIEPELMKKNQYVSLDTYRVIDTRSPITLQQRTDQITDLIENAGSLRWTFFVTLRELQQAGDWKKSEQTWGPLCYEKVLDSGACNTTSSMSTNSVAASNVALSGYRPMQAYSLGGMRTMDEASTNKITYHNLKREDGFLPVPQAVSNRPSCGGVKNCAQGLRFVRISFDVVEWDSETHGTKTNVRFTYSSDIPTYIQDWLPGKMRFSNQVDACYQTWFEIKNDTQTQIVPVRDCMEITDFQFGS